MSPKIGKTRSADDPHGSPGLSEGSKCRSRVRLLAVAIGCLAVLGCAYWVYRGVVVFRMEMLTFEETRDGLDESALLRARAVVPAARLVTWQLTDGSRQRALYLPPRNGAAIVYAHGAPGSGSGLLPEALAMAETGFGALLLDLPGYGESEGSRDWGPAFQASIRHAVDFVVAQAGVDPRRIGGFGYSMGTQAMARAAADDPRIAGLILLAAFTNYPDVLRNEYRSRIPGLSYFALAADLLYGSPVNEMDVLAALRHVGHRPVLVIAGREDHVTTAKMASELSSTAANGQLWIVDGTGHTGFSERIGEPYFARLRNFWGATLAR